MSKIKNGGLDQYGKYKPLTGSAVKGLKTHSSLSTNWRWANSVPFCHVAL